MNASIVLDIFIEDEGTVALLTPVTPRALKWCQKRLDAGTPRFGPAYVIDHRFIGDIVEALFDSDLNFQYSVRGGERAN